MTKPTIRRIFNRFRPSRTGVFRSYDHETRSITWRPDGEDADVTDWVQHGLDIDPGTFEAGQRLRVQDGEINNESSAMRGGRRWLPIGVRGAMREANLYTGYACIAAIAHPAPRLSLLGFRLLEQVFLPHVVPVHLRHFAEGASTRQTRLTVHTNRWDLDMRVRNGRLTAMRRLSNSVTVDEDKVAFDCGGMPDTLISALEGRPLRDLVAHPALMDDDLVIDYIHRSDSRAWAHIRPVTLTPDEAISRLRRTQAMAA